MAIDMIGNAAINHQKSIDDRDTHENVKCHKKAVTPCTKKSTHMAKLVWDSTNEAGQALIKAVNDGIIDEDVPFNLVKKTNKLQYYTFLLCPL